jgi:tetratricopeptide (TPR) repeat protein
MTLRPLLVAMLAVGAQPWSVHAQDLLTQAKALERRGRLDSAYTIIQRAAAAEPNRAEVHWWLGNIAGERAQQIGGLGAYGAARKCKAGYARAVQLEPDNPDYLEGLIGYLSQAPGIVGGDRDSALVLAEALRRIDETRGTFQMASVLLRGNRGEKASADSIMDAWGRAHEGDRVAQFRVAGHFAQSNQPERALAIHERLLARDPADVVAQYGVARNLVVLKRDARRALGLLGPLSSSTPPPPSGPSYQLPGVWWRMGQAYVQLGKPDSARTAYQQALVIAPQFRQARMSLDSLR